MDYEEFSKSLDKTIKERNGIIDLYKQLIAAKENTINYKNIAIDSLNKEIGLLNSEIKEEKEKKNELYDKYISIKTLNDFNTKKYEEKISKLISIKTLNDFNTKKYEEKISKLECENKFLTETSKELSKLLADYQRKAELNKNIEYIEWFPLEQKPEKEKTYLVRYLWANSYSIGFAGYNYICGFPTESDCVITHWAEFKGPKL